MKRPFYPLQSSLLGGKQTPPPSRERLPSRKHWMLRQEGRLFSEKEGKGAGDSPRLLSSVSCLHTFVTRQVARDGLSRGTLGVILLIVAFALFFGGLAVQQHRTFQTNGMDLGNVDQALWQTAQGHFLRFSLMTPVESRLALHVEPILLLFVPLYWVGLGSPETLLLIQAAVVALGAWPLARIAHHKLGGGGWLFALAYLLLPTLESAVLFDFHAVTLAPTFVLFAFLALAEERPAAFFIWAGLAMACKEDMPLVVGMLGLYAGLARRRWRLAGLTMVLSAAWFGLAVFLIQGRLVGGNIQLGRYAWLGNGPPEMILTMLSRPGLVFNHLWHEADLPGYLARLFLPTAFLALLSPLTLLPMLPTLAINLLSDNPFSWRLEDFHYGATLAPFLLISAIYGIARLGGDNSRRRLLLSLLLLVCSLSYHHYRGFTPLARPFGWPARTAHHHQLETMMTTIPPETALFAQSNLAPHLTHRPTLYTDFAYFTDPAFPAEQPVEAALLDVTGFENQGGLHQFLGRELPGLYHIETARDGILYLKPPSAGEKLSLPPAFYTFARPAAPSQYSPTVDFGELVRLRGYSLHFHRQEEIELDIDLEPLRPLPPDLQPVLYLLDEMGQPVGATTDRQPTLVWFPPEQWPVGEPVRVRFNTFPWHTRRMPGYRLALGLVQGEDVWQEDRRHPPANIQSGPLALRLPAGRSLLELARLRQVGGMPTGGPPERRLTPPRIARPLPANFANRLTLLGYADLEPAPARLSIRLYWRAVIQPPELIRFVQLVGPDGRLYGQQDSAPDNGHYPTDLWQPGEIVAERVTFPLAAERPPGQYTLHIGLYAPQTGQRLPRLSGGDHVEIPLPFLHPP